MCACIIRRRKGVHTTEYAKAPSGMDGAFIFLKLSGVEECSRTSHLMHIVLYFFEQVLRVLGACESQNMFAASKDVIRTGSVL